MRKNGESDDERRSSALEDKRPIPLKWVFFAILLFAIGYHVALLLNHT